MVVSILTGLPLFGEAHAIGVVLKGVDKNKLDFRNKALTYLKYSANKATYLSLIQYFESSVGDDILGDNPKERVNRILKNIYLLNNDVDKSYAPYECMIINVNQDMPTNKKDKYK